MLEDKLSRCPKCGSENVVPIVYGRTTFEMAKQEKAGEIHIGGESIENDGSKWYCNDCGYKWGGKSSLL
ncbi:hypothetical protein SMSP2_02949 [Limihaloglobus sulfuriphilus]|uniref:Uncharacterized protein n=1 Tax=Limihaloglobus sulfuriphilus TaxID=1851148 RepID=A0A1Q2MIS0_9BACT|nr:hypothetical protein [Limihaloglobus sulfuriphilus]AQQ72559.1 hypothetical protein SMSP2_02949 [Limihaloglobus sulfuriphilus]